MIPRVRAVPGIRVEETRLAASLDASTGPVYLWVAPSERGGQCLFLQVVGNEQPNGRSNLSGGCGRGSAPVDSTLSGTRVRDGRWLSLVYGRVEAPVVRVELELSDKAFAVPLTGRFFLYELPGAADGDSPPIAVVGYDAAGGEVARRRHGGPAGLGGRPLALEPREDAPLLEIRTRRTQSPIRLYVVERDGRRCTVLVSPGGTSSGCPGRPPAPREIAVAPNQIGSAPDGMLLLWGEVGREIHRLELRFEDGRVERLPLVDGFSLYQVDPDDFVAGRRPVALVGRSANGDVVAQNELGPWRP